MNVLFWICWVLGLIFFLFILWATGFRSGFGASTDFNVISMFVLGAILLAALVTKMLDLQQWIPMSLLLLPFLILLIMYIVDTAKG